MIEANSTAYWRATSALALGSFMTFSNLYVTHPLLPLLTEAFAITSLQAAWSFAIATLTLGLSLLIYGPLSDAWGRKWIMVATLLGSTATTLLLAWSPDYTSLLLLRALQGFFLAGLPAIAIAYMGDEYSRPALLTAVGLYIGGNTLGGISGRLVGGFVAEWSDWSTAFLVMGAISLGCMTLFVWLLPSSRNFQRSPLHIGQVGRDIVGHLRNPLLLTAYLIGGLNFAIFINQYSYITFVLADAPYHLPPSILGLLFLTYLSGTFSSSISGRLAQRAPQSLCMLSGIIILMLGSLFTLFGSLWTIVTGLLINAFGFFLAHSMATSWVSRHATRARATASSLYLVFYYLGASGGGFYLDPFWQRADWPGVIAASLAVLLFTGFCAARLYRAERRALQAAQIRLPDSY